MRIVALVALMLAATSCAQRSDYVFVMPVESSAEDVRAATDAAAEWQSCELVTVSVRVGTPEGEDVPLRRVDAIADYPLRSGDTFTVDGSPKSITFAHVTTLTQTTIAHEMGHALGLAHTNQGLMQAHYSGARYVTFTECHNLRAAR